MRRLTMPLIALASLAVVGCANQRGDYTPRRSFDRSMTDSSQAQERERAKGRIPPAHDYPVPGRRASVT